ncbi:CDP-diacylglycerol--inositol 3-phosphatidyltransferase-like [Sycon ciliatum]|uniref:CDP-diacylglycerol--inositol 3-phosphatidyltransferase-like n=1 Tax=Sycon ciliatum TaxID=27933 RepID=UPI0031F66DE1
MGDENIFLFIPNLIGYVRVILLIVACFFMDTDPWTTVALYLLSQFLDAFDGQAARYFQQSTKFGAVLDMVTDRCSTLCLFIVLGQFYPGHLVTFQLLAILDIASHWIHMYSALVRGDSSHKTIDLAGNPVLRYYYTNRYVLFFFCAANELCFAALYFMYFSPGPLFVFVPWDVEPWGMWKLLFAASLPFCAMKQLISVIQMIVAAKNIGVIDVAERAKLRS